MDHKKLLKHYQNSPVENVPFDNNKGNSETTLPRNYRTNINNGHVHVAPYTDNVDSKRSTLSTFSNNRKKRKWDGAKAQPILIEQYDDHPTQYINGVPSALRCEDGTYRRLHEHINECSINYDSYSRGEGNFTRKHSKVGSYKLLFLICVLLFFLMMYIPVYNQANRRSACDENCSVLLHYINNNSSFNTVNVTMNFAKPFAQGHTVPKLKRIKFFEKLWSSSNNKGSVPGWSFNTSRDTRSYVLPDNVTLLNQPKSICKTKQAKSQSSHPVIKLITDEIFLLVIICSSMDHFEARSAIRDTWGNQTNYDFLAKRIKNVTQHFENVNVTEKMLTDFSDFSNFSFVDRRIKRDLTSETYYGDNDGLEIDGVLQFDSVLNLTVSENNGDNSDISVDLLNDNFDRITINKISLEKAVILNDTDTNLADTLSFFPNTDSIFLNENGETMKVIHESQTNEEYMVSIKNTPMKNERDKRDVSHDKSNVLALSKNVNKRSNPTSNEARFDYGDAVSDQTRSDATYTDNKILGNFEENDVSKNENLDFYDYQTEVSNIMRIPPRGQKFSDDEQIENEQENSKKILELTMNGDKLKLQTLKHREISKNSVNLNDHLGSIKENTSQTNKVENKQEHVDFLKPSDETNSEDVNLPNSDPPIRIKFVFLLGQSSTDNNTDIQMKIDDESALHGDLIQESFIDSYNNLTLKSVMLLKWVVSNCGDNVRYIMKTDDDMYVNIPRLIDALQNKSTEYVQKVLNHRSINDHQKINNTAKNALLKNEKLLMGDLICDARPISDTSSKWYSPTYMFGGKVYPKYLSGTGYVMSFGTAKELYQAALDTPLFHLEDIYITGICSLKAGIKPTDHSGFSYSVRKFDPCIYIYLITAHQVSPLQLRKMHGLLNIPLVLESCEMKHIWSKKKSSLLSNVKEILMKNPLSLGSPKSFINGLANLGMVDTKITKLATKKRKRPNNGCF